jgi:hypothetical protein
MLNTFAPFASLAVKALNRKERKGRKVPSTAETEGIFTLGLAVENKPVASF